MPQTPILAPGGPGAANQVISSGAFHRPSSCRMACFFLLRRFKQALTRLSENLVALASSATDNVCPQRINLPCAEVMGSFRLASRTLRTLESKHLSRKNSQFSTTFLNFRNGADANVTIATV